MKDMVTWEKEKKRSYCIERKTRDFSDNKTRYKKRIIIKLKSSKILREKWGVLSSIWCCCQRQSRTR